jgi:hypothetical protein
MIGLIALTLLAMGRVCTHEFVEWDDPSTIARNPDFAPPSIARIARYWTTPAGSLYVPLTYSTWGALAYVAQLPQPDDFGSTLNPWIYHSFNLLLHAATTLLVFLLLLELRFAAWPAAVGAAVFAVHPVQVEAVAWASGTKDLLCSLLVVCSMIAIVRYRHRPTTWRCLGCWCAVLLACLSKPTGIIAPFFCLIVDTMILRTHWRQSLRLLWPGFVIALIFAIVGRIVQPQISAAYTPWFIRPLVAADAIAFYLWKIVWPMKPNIDYGRTPEAIVRSGVIYLTWIAPVALALILWRFRRRASAAFPAIFVALVGVAPVLGLVGFTFQSYSTVSDHYLYPAMIGVAMLCALLFARVNRSPMRWGAAAVIALLTGVSIYSEGFWRNSQSLFTRAIEVNPRSFAAYTNRAVDLGRHGRDQEAVADLRRAIEINPDYAFAHLNLARHQMRHADPAGALASFRRVFEIYSTQKNYDPALAAGVEAAIASMLAKEGHVSEAADTLKDALKRDPGNASLRAQLDGLRIPASTRSTDR